MTPLAKLDSLRHLHLRHTRVKDIMPLASLTHLQTLTLDGAPVAKADVDSLERKLPRTNLSGP